MKDNDWFYSAKFTVSIYMKYGQAFEDFFCEIMKSSDDSFNKVKASGRIGDRSCDGFNASTGDYYLCYSPENIKKTLTANNAVSKIQNDISGIIKKWAGIVTINYVINDKFMGLSPQIHELLSNLKSLNPSISIELFSMEKLRKICLSLNDLDKQRILGYCPDLTNSKAVADFDTISKIIEYIEKNTTIGDYGDNLTVPDFSQKISFNNLTNKVADLLNNARYHINKIEDFYNNMPAFNKDDLRNHLRGIYSEAVSTIDNAESNYSDEVFFYILNKITYKPDSKAVTDNALIILASFFESCDIFEEPVESIDEQVNA